MEEAGLHAAVGRAGGLYAGPRGIVGGLSAAHPGDDRFARRGGHRGGAQQYSLSALLAAGGRAHPPLGLHERADSLPSSARAGAVSGCPPTLARCAPQIAALFGCASPTGPPRVLLHPPSRGAAPP